MHPSGDFAAMEVSVDLDEVQLGAMATDLAATLCQSEDAALLGMRYS